MPKLKTKSGAKKRFKITGTGKVLYAQPRQAPRHDQADQQADPPAARHRRPVQDRRRQHQEVLPAQRLIAGRPSRPPSHQPVVARNPKEISHGSRQTWRHRARQAQEGPQGRQGLLRPAQEHHPHRQAGGRQGQPVRLPRPQDDEAHLPRAVDPAPQRRGAPVRPDLQPIHRRPRQGRASRSTARCCPTSPSASRRRSRRSSRRPRPRWRPDAVARPTSCQAGRRTSSA